MFVCFQVHPSSSHTLFQRKSCFRKRKWVLSRWTRGNSPSSIYPMSSRSRFGNMPTRAGSSRTVSGVQSLKASPRNVGCRGCCSLDMLSADTFLRTSCFRPGAGYPLARPGPGYTQVRRLCASWADVGFGGTWGPGEPRSGCTQEIGVSSPILKPPRSLPFEAPHVDAPGRGQLGCPLVLAVRTAAVPCRCRRRFLHREARLPLLIA